VVARTTAARTLQRPGEAFDGLRVGSAPRQNVAEATPGELIERQRLGDARRLGCAGRGGALADSAATYSPRGTRRRDDRDREYALASGASAGEVPRDETSTTSLSSRICAAYLSADGVQDLVLGDERDRCVVGRQDERHAVEPHEDTKVLRLASTTGRQRRQVLVAPRTRGRHLPAGEATPGHASVFALRHIGGRWGNASGNRVLQ
jgi:hypothetical protein